MKTGPAVETSEPAKLNIQVSTESKAKMFFGLIPTKEIVRGQKFKIKLTIRNMSRTKPFKGRYHIDIVYPTRERNRIKHEALQPWEPGSELTEEIEFEALSEGYALIEFYPERGESIEIVDDAGNTIEHGPASAHEPPALGIFHVTTNRDIYAFYAVVISLFALLIIAAEKVVSLLNFFLRRQP